MKEVHDMKKLVILYFSQSGICNIRETGDITENYSEACL